MKNVILFASVGRTDIQVLMENGDGEQCRMNFPPPGLRKLHQALLDGKLPFVFQTPDLEKVKEHPQDLYVHFQTDREGNIQDPALVCTKAPEWKPVKEEGKYVLVPAKLISVVKTIKKEIEENHTNFLGAVVLSTHSGDELFGTKIYEKEPIACGKLLSEWLANTLSEALPNSQPPITASAEGKEIFECDWQRKTTWVDILDGGMRATEPGRDDPVNRTAIKRVDEVMRKIVSDEPDTTVLLCLGGGLPLFKDSLKDCARFHFRNRVVYWHEPQYMEEGEEEIFLQREVEDEPPSIQESYQARNHARTLIRKGDFSGAYSAVQHLESDPMEKLWVEKVKLASQYFSGELAGTEGLPDYIGDLMGNTPASLLVGMRCEAALRAGRLVEAVAWTSTFLGAALFDGMKSLTFISKVDNLHRTVEVTNPGAIPRTLTERQGNAGACLFDKRELNFSSRRIIKYRYDIIGQFEDIWISQMTQSLKNALRRYKLAIDTEISVNNVQRIPRLYRNVNLHNIIPQHETDNIKTVFWLAGLWNNPQEWKTHAFLGQNLCKNVLTALDCNNPLGLYNNLVNGLEKDLIEHGIS